MKNIIKIALIFIAFIVLLLLQYQLWFGENGYTDKRKLKKDIIEQQQLVDKQLEANRILQEDVRDLKSGLEAVEEHARLDLGLIKAGETFIQISTTKSDAGIVQPTTELKSVRTIEVIPEPLVNLPKSDTFEQEQAEAQAEKQKQAQAEKQKQAQAQKQKQAQAQKQKQAQAQKQKQAQAQKQKQAQAQAEKQKQAQAQKQKQAQAQKQKQAQAQKQVDNQ